MKKLFYFFVLIIFLTINNNAYACLPNGIKFTTQSQIDSFPINYPDCTVIDGNLTIREETKGNITNLNGLSSIKIIKGTLYLRNIDSLLSFSGLDNLESIHKNLTLFLIPNLIDISALKNLTTIGGNFLFSNIYSLTSLSGLENLKNIGGDFTLSGVLKLENILGLKNLKSIGGYLYLSNVKKIQDLSGLENLNSVGGYIYITNNLSIESLSGIQNINPYTIKSRDTSYMDLGIKYNRKLSECSIRSICDFLDIPGRTKEIHNNLPGCNSIEEVEDACPTPPPCTVLSYPASGDTDIDISTEIRWEPIDEAEGYIVRIGSTPDTFDILFYEDIGNVTSFVHGDLPYESSIYVTIIPYDNTRNASVCTIDSFSTQNCPVLSVNSIQSNISCYGYCDGNIEIIEVANGHPPYIYNWNNEDTTPSITNLCEGVYSVEITDSKNCTINQEYTLTQPDEILITIDSTIDIRSGTLGAVYISTNHENYVYSWSGPGGFLSDNEDIYDLNIKGCYTLLVTDTTANCSKDTTICIDDLSTTMNYYPNDIQIFPNPANEIIFIEYNSLNASDIEIELYTCEGVKINNTRLDKNQINISNLNQGIYFIKFLMKGNFFIKKIIVVK